MPIEDYKDPRWQQKASEVKTAAGWRCEDCGRSVRDGYQFDVHHTAYVHGRKLWDYPAELLMCVCRPCHKRRQSLEDAFRVALGELTRFLKPVQLEEEVWRILQEVRFRETRRLAASFTGEELN